MKYQFPNWLKRSPEEEDQEREVQEQRRAGFSRAKLTREEEMISRGALLEETARGNLEVATREKEELLNSETEDRITKAQLLNVQIAEEQTRLAHARSLQGRFTEAVEVEPVDEMKTHYQQIVDAIEMDDSVKCPCEDTEGVLNGVEIAITPRFESREIFSQRHGKVVSIVTCGKCGHQNARVPNSRIPIAKAAEKQNRAAVTAGRGFKSDVELLKK